MLVYCIIIISLDCLVGLFLGRFHLFANQHWHWTEDAPYLKTICQVFKRTDWTQTQRPLLTHPMTSIASLL